MCFYCFYCWLHCVIIVKYQELDVNLWMFVHGVTQSYICEYGSKYVQVNHLSLSKRNISLYWFYEYDLIGNSVNFRNYSQFWDISCKDKIKAKNGANSSSESIFNIDGTNDRNTTICQVNRLYHCQIDVYSEVLDSDNVIDVDCDNENIESGNMITKMLATNNLCKLELLIINSPKSKKS